MFAFSRQRRSKKNANTDLTTRKHSSRMRTVRCSDRRGGVPARGEGCTWQVPPPNRGQNDRRLWKYYLAATSLRTVTIERGVSAYNELVYNEFVYNEHVLKKRMHSSGMRTIRLLTISQHALPGGGLVCSRVSTRGVFLPRGVSAGGVSQYAMGQTPHCGQTDTCENITFANFVCGR